MIARHTITYLGSRTVAAALNMASLAIFTRLAPVETYGTYLLALSWALILYCATSQWPKFAFFALYDEQRSAAQIGTLARLLLATSGLSILAATLAAAFGFAAPRTAAAVAAAAIGTTVFESTVEVARTRLAAEAVGLSVVARGVFVLGFGSAALAWTGDPLDLVFAVAAANTLAVLPAGRTVATLVRGGHGSMAEARSLFAYGWPLILSFGIAALAQVIDRLILGKLVGPQELGAYGAFGDFLRQSFVVFGESIALSMISIAKRDARTSGMEAARIVLREAARALTLVCAFGAVFFLAFDDLVVSILLGPDYRGAALALAPLLVAANVCTVFRSYYFGQVIYFAGSSILDAVASGALLLVVASLSLVLIPRYGAGGAATALAAGQAIACLVYILGARGGVRMPVPVVDLALIALIALGTAAAISMVGLVPGGSSLLGTAFKLAVLGLAAGVAAWHFNIIGFADTLAHLRRRAA